MGDGMHRSGALHFCPVVIKDTEPGNTYQSFVYIRKLLFLADRRLGNQNPLTVHLINSVGDGIQIYRFATTLQTVLY